MLSLLIFLAHKLTLQSQQMFVSAIKNCSKNNLNVYGKMKISQIIPVSPNFHFDYKFLEQFDEEDEENS